MIFCDLFKEFQPIRVDQNIYLRQHKPEKDARVFWEIYSDEENFKYFGLYRRLEEWSEEREIRAVVSRIKGFKGKREYSWVITFKGEAIGQIQLFNFYNHNTCAEVGYFIKRKYWNQGINTKVLMAVCKFGIEVMGFERIEAIVHVDNIGSNRSLQKAGFRKEGLMKKRFWLNGKVEDGNMYSLIREDLIETIND